MVRWWMYLMGAVALAVAMMAVACGGDDDDSNGGDGSPAASSKTTSSGDSATQASNGETNADGQSVTGQVQLSGKLNGTFSWNKDLAVNWCATVRADFTMTDGKDTYIALGTATLNDGTDESNLSSARLSGGFKGKSAKIDAKKTNNGLGATGSVTWSNIEMKNTAGDSVTVNGTLKFVCP